jgi:DNA processing protein
MDPVRTLTPADAAYPRALLRLPDAPAALRVRGALPEARRVALVGSRAPDEYGSWAARTIAAGLARAGVTVVSGGALGVDGEAHRAAVDAGGRTEVVLGTGVDVPYPSRHRKLFADVLAAGGALVSEQPDGTPGYLGNFPARNRIIAALCEVVVVVRAARQSGALITAARARDLRVPLLAVPGDARDELSEGTNRLLRDGARAVTSAADVLAALGVAAPPPPAQLALPTLSSDAAAIHAALTRKPRHADEIARAARVPTSAALAGLLELELLGLCEQRPGHAFLRRET